MEPPRAPASGKPHERQRVPLPMQKYRLLIHYRGTRYAGWQVQPDRRTIQGELQKAILRVCRQERSVVASGRTDAGVHARGQVAHFSLSEMRAAGRLRTSLNAILPADIRIMGLRTVHRGFHAQRDARRKRYEYRIYNGPVLSPFLADYVLHFRGHLDVRSMQTASRLVTGRHDFSGFTSSRSTVSFKVRTVSLSELSRRGLFLSYRVEGDGFLHHQIRNITGTLLEVGTGRLKAADMQEILRSRDRKTAGPTAPAHGLCLVKVWY